MKKRSIALGLLTALALPAMALAAYPEKPISVIVPSTAGGGTDTMARIVAKFAEPLLGQPMVIVNKPGAGGQIGFEAIARAKADGYTIGCLYTPHLTAHVSDKRAGYTNDSFYAIANVVTDPGILVVPANSPFKTMADMVAAAQAEGAHLTAGTSGPGGDDDFARGMTEESCGIKLTPVPSKGSSDAKATVMGGHVDMSFMNVSQVEAQIKSGDLRALAVLTKARVAELPDVPTALEQGYDGIFSDSSRGFAAPAGVSDEVKAKLDEVFAAVMKDPEFLKAAEGQLQLNVMDHAAYAEYLAEQQKMTDRQFEVNPW